MAYLPCRIFKRMIILKTMKKYLLCVFVVFVMLFCGAYLYEADAAEITEYPEDGTVLEEGDACCDCCHKHAHTGGIFDRYSCFACKIMTFLRSFYNKPQADDAVHRYFLTDSVTPTCVSEGERTYECGVCEKTVSITDEKLPHIPQTIKGKEAACTEDGLTDGAYCLKCNGTLIVQSVIPELGHDTVTDIRIAPTCLEDGLTEGKHCGRCNEVFISQERIPATGHDFTDGDTVANLKTYKSGTNKVTADITCYSCKEKFTDFNIDAAASVGGYDKIYHTLEKAISSAENQNVYLLEDYILKENLNIGNGVTLVIPAFTGDTGPIKRSDDGFYSYYCADNYTQVINKHSFRVLTVPEGKTVNIGSSGTLFISAVTGLFGGGNPESYGISDGYGQIALGGTINVKSGGIFDCSGYVTDGGGTVNLEKGAKMFETYGILYWRGGSYGMAANTKKIFPIDGYEMNCMQAKLNIAAGAVLLGNCKMCAGSLTDLQSSQYYYCHFKLLGYGDGYLYQLQDGARAQRTVDENGRVTIKFYGDVYFGTSSITVGLTDFKTSNFQTYKIDGNYTYEFYDGTVTCYQKCQFMPGAQMIVGKGAVVNILYDMFKGTGALIFCTAKDYENRGYYYYDSQYVGALYPAGRDDARLIVKDGGKVNVNGSLIGKTTLAGMVYVDSKSSVNFNRYSNTSIELNVAIGPIKGASILASVDIAKYKVVYKKNAL